jgi:hypothetical protein
MLHLCWYYIFTGCYTEGAPRNGVPEGAPGNGVPGLIRVLRLTIVRRLPLEALSKRPRPRPWYIKSKEKRRLGAPGYIRTFGTKSPSLATK